MLGILFTFAHVVVSIILILVVLLQTGKRADLAGAFGGGGSQTAFGARGAATLFSKATTICAVVFMVTSLGLSILSSNRQDRGTTVLDSIPAGPAQTAPLIPGDTGTTPPSDGGAALPSDSGGADSAPSGAGESPAGDAQPQ